LAGRLDGERGGSANEDANESKNRETPIGSRALPRAEVSGQVSSLRARPVGLQRPDWIVLPGLRLRRAGRRL